MSSLLRNQPAPDFWQLVRIASERASESGALQAIATRQLVLKDHGAEFVVRILAGLAQKPRGTASSSNPFLPYDPQMFVTDIPPHHVGLLNKFQVLEDHVLIVTREFQPQQSPLDADDFRALCWSLDAAAAEQREALSFYNGGKLAGASQPHKHLQVVPLPLGDLGSAFPLEPLLLGNASRDIYQATGLPFAHSAVRFDPPLDATSAPRVYEHYLQMLQRHQLWREGEQQVRPYNLLVTRAMMLLVPRSAECFHEISLNALAFAGALLVKNDEQLDHLERHGPWSALRHVTFPA